ncbi:MAG TPA: hypothetical protein VI316_06320 [Candidatus Dormibacteraeota bacterium]
MIIVVGLALGLLAIIAIGEWSDARLSRRLYAPAARTRVRPSQLPEPLIPSSIQRSSGCG